MKREALNHSKMKRLCRRLGIPRWQAVGLLESIWALAAMETPRGDIGKLSNEDIADAIEYEGDAGQMIDGLVAARWLDPHPEFRLVVHDWFDHADDAVHMKLARARLAFWDGSPPKLTRLSMKERAAVEQHFASSKKYTTLGDIKPVSAPRTALNPEPPREDPAVRVTEMLPAFLKRIKAPFDADMGMCQRLAMSMVRNGKTAQFFEQILRDLEREKVKPRAAGFLITVIEGRLSGFATTAEPAAINTQQCATCNDNGLILPAGDLPWSQLMAGAQVCDCAEGQRLRPEVERQIAEARAEVEKGRAA